MTEFNQAVCRYGVLILKDGKIMTTEEVVAELTALQEDSDRLLHLVNSGAFRIGSADMGSNHTWVGVGRPIGKGSTVMQAIDNARLSTHNGGEG